MQVYIAGVATPLYARQEAKCRKQAKSPSLVKTKLPTCEAILKTLAASSDAPVDEVSFSVYELYQLTC